MNIKKYSILYKTSKKTAHTTCTSNSLFRLITNFIKNDDAQALLVIISQNETLEEKQEELDKRKYYNSKYASFYRKYKKQRITKAEFEDIVIMLKKYRKICKTKKEFELIFEKYQNRDDEKSKV